VISRRRLPFVTRLSQPSVIFMRAFLFDRASLAFRRPIPPHYAIAIFSRAKASFAATERSLRS
jgi:hypothetical protein